MAVTHIKNDTGHEVMIRKSYSGIYVSVGTIKVGGKWKLLVDLCETYNEYLFQAVFSPSELPISSDDFPEWSEISIQMGPDGAFGWVGTLPRDLRQYLKPARESARDVSLKFDEALRSCANLEKLCKRVKICCHQSNHLVQTYKEGIQKIAQLYSRLIEDGIQIVRLYRDKRLMKLGNSLDRLEYIICDAKDLLGSCATELGKVALIVSRLRPPVEKDVEVYSDFDLLIRELQWHLDVIEYLIYRQGQAKLEWSPTMCRYVLRRSPGDRNIVAQEKVVDQEKAANQKKPNTLAYMDHEELQSGLKDGLIYFPNTIFGWCTRRFFGLGENNLNVTVLERCKAHEDLQSHQVDLENLEINHLDLHPYLHRRLGKGSFKKTYEGKWYGESVAIATIRMANSDTSHLCSKMFEDEVGRLIQLQHPKVVSFFGWAETSDAPEPIKKPNDKHHVKGGYIVTEKMECDLNELIQNKEIEKKNNQGGPFSHSVEIDILQQIVEAMLHVQKQGYVHRDVKPGNFLVNSRSSPRPDADTYYNVKLIDFGSSKLYVGEDGNTYNVGTTSYGAPEMMKGLEKEADRGKYDMSVDVFSFAMTCYQVITGRIPFQGTSAFKALKNKERPEFQQTVLYGLKELTEACWHENPQERPSFEEIQKRLWTIKMKLAVD